MTKIIIAILVAVAIINAVVAYACCAVAGRADDAADKWMKDIMNEKTEGD